MAKRAVLVALFFSSVIALWGGITLASQQSGAGPAGLSGSYPVDLNLQSDICGHDQYIFGQNNRPPHNMKLTVAVDGNNVTINGLTPWVNVNGTLGTGGSFVATGQGTVAGYSNTQVSFSGTLTGGQITGKYTFGNTNPPGQGGLPPCGPVGAQVSHPAVYGVKPKPTPTPTPKLYSIIVLKLNDNNLQPLSGWLMRLYSGTGCQGNPLSSHSTDLHGLYDFEGLPPGSYSVAEVSQTGWNPDGPTCRDVSLPGVVASGIVAACPIPNEVFPQPGCDGFLSAAKVNITFNGTGQVIPVELSGPTLIERKNKPRDINGNGLDEIQTEMVQLDLSGGGGVTVHLAPSPASTGLIEEQLNTTQGTLDFPANSFFDVFFEVVINGVTLHNTTPLHVQCKITEIPPYKCLYFPAISDPILLFDPQGVKVAELLHGLHIPIPPNEEIVIFSNRPKGTTTPAPTLTPTPTRTGTPTPATTPARTGTPTPAATPTPSTPQPKQTEGFEFYNNASAVASDFEVRLFTRNPNPGGDLQLNNPRDVRVFRRNNLDTPVPITCPAATIQVVGANRDTIRINWDTNCVKQFDGITFRVDAPQKFIPVYYDPASIRWTKAGTPQPTKTQNPTQTPNPNANVLEVPLSFYNIGAAPWDAANVKAMLAHANAVWAQASIHFTWDNNPTMHHLADNHPPPAPGGDGDLQSADQGDMCNNIVAERDRIKQRTFPVGLMGFTVDAAGKRDVYDWGLTFLLETGPGATPPPSPNDTATTNQLGECMLLSLANKDTPEPKTGETLAHELGHVLCLDHVRDTSDLMHNKFATANKLNAKQIAIARDCAARLRTNLGLPPSGTPVATPTPTHPPEATPTATPRPRNGDANKDGVTNPIDATFVLQFSAGLLPTINPSSDVNGDGVTNPIDGTLILQFSAGLLNMLPVM